MLISCCSADSSTDRPCMVYRMAEKDRTDTSKDNKGYRPVVDMDAKGAPPPAASGSGSCCS